MSLALGKIPAYKEAMSLRLLVSGQISVETAKFLSEHFTKIFQDRERVFIGSRDTFIFKLNNSNKDYH